jgi:cell division protein FtsL
MVFAAWNPKQDVFRGKLTRFNKYLISVLYNSCQHKIIRSNKTVSIENYFAVIAAVTAIISLAMVMLGKVFKLGQTAQTVKHIEQDIKDNIKPELKELRSDVTSLKTDVAVMKKDVKVLGEKIDLILDVVRLKPKINRPAIK